MPAAILVMMMLALCASAQSAATQQFEREGVVVSFSIQAGNNEKESSGLKAGADAVATFRFTDKRTGQPIKGLRPSAWLVARKGDSATNESECKETIRALVGGLLSTRADVDLNAYKIVTLNHDNTVSFINPQVAFSLTKLEALITLPGAGSGWALSANKDFLYVAMPEQYALAVINTNTKKLTGTVPTGAGRRPVSISLQPDGRYAWVGFDGPPVVVAVDTSTNKVAANTTVGIGVHDFVFTPDSRFAYVTNGAVGTVSVIDTKSFGKIADISVGRSPGPAAYSSASRLVYVAAAESGAITAIDPAKQKAVASIPTKRGVVALKFDRSGRYGFAVNQGESEVDIIDASTNKVITIMPVVKGADQIAFTERYAYIRGVDSEKVSLIELAEAAKGKVAPVDVIMGRAAPNALAEEVGASEMIAPTPEGNSVMVANTPDAMIYYYVEGMAAPMGTFSNYKRRPHALLLIDRSLSETAPGIYSTHLTLPKAGRYDVPFLLDQPRLFNCFQLDVTGAPGEKSGPSVVIEAMFKGQHFKPEEKNSLRFKITDAVTKQPVKGLDDVQVLVFEPPGIWQQRQWAREVEDGVYEITQTFPHVGLFNVMLRIQSRGINYADLPFTSVTVEK